MLHEITSVENFEEAIQGSKVLMEFFQPWCHFCQGFQPTIEEYANLSSSIPTYQVSGEKFPQIFDAFGVDSFPTLMVFEYGKPVLKESGGMELGQLQEFVAQAE